MTTVPRRHTQPFFLQLVIAQQDFVNLSRQAFGGKGPRLRTWRVLGSRPGRLGEPTEGTHDLDGPLDEDNGSGQPCRAWALRSELLHGVQST